MAELDLRRDSKKGRIPMISKSYTLWVFEIFIYTLNYFYTL